MSLEIARQRIRHAYETQATSLNLSGLWLKALPNELQELPWLEELICDGSADWENDFMNRRKGFITDLPTWVSRFYNLKILSLKGNKIQQLNPALFQLEQLQELELGSNRISNLPAGINSLKQLRKFSISNNKLQDLPSALFELDHLEVLNLSSNNLDRIPKEIGLLRSLSKLSIQLNHLTSLPAEIALISNLTSLSISSTQLTTIPSEIGQLIKLTTLDLISSQLTTIPSEIGQLIKLTSLSISSTQLTTIPPEIGHLIKLTSLRISSTQLTTIPPEIGQLTNLTSLSISSTQLTTIPPEIGQLTNLTSLDLSDNQLSSLPAEITQLTNLTSLYLGSNKLTTIPPEIAQLTNLTSLYLSSNKLSTLPAEIAQLTSLDSFNLMHNQMTTLPTEIAQLTSLTSLDLDSNQLSSIPIEISQLISLRSLDLRNNQLTTIPAEISTLTNLSSLYLNGNQLTSIPPEINILINLTSLSISGTQLTTLPTEIANLSNLTELYLSGNQLTTLPSEITQLPKLIELHLMNNQFTSISPEIFQLQFLTSLDLEGNQITSIPKEIKQLEYLETLDLANNQLTSLPIEITELRYLEQLRLKKNPLRIPSELIESKDLLFEYLQQCQEDGSKPLNEAKVIVVGQGTVGKTSVIKRLLHNQFNPHELKTDGIVIERKHYQIDQQSVQVNLWDFGGQEIMHATHQFFMTKRSVYLLVLNCRDSDHMNRIEYWLKLIQSFAADSPILIIGNQVDQHPLDLDQRGLMLKYPQIKGFVATSCKDGRGFDELNQQICQQLQSLKHINDLLPASWWRIKQQLETMQRDYISHDMFQKLCSDEHVTNNTTQQIVLRLLNDLGTVLSYHDDPRLADTNVLNPEWVTNGVYTLINHKPLLEKTSGRLSTSELIEVLSQFKGRYPANKCHFITEMMEKFELCYQISRDQWLLPDLLPKNEPETGEWNDALHFIYQYPVLPSSIMARFIVRSQFSLIEALLWRSGAVLEIEENRALVKADLEAAQIHIRIIGEPSQRRRTLSAIRQRFEQIHASLSGLHKEIKTYVPLPHTGELYPYDSLLKFEKRNIKQTYIPEADADIDIQQLLDGYESNNERQARQVDPDHYEQASLEHLEMLYQIQQSNLQQCQLQKAQHGESSVPLYITNEIKKITTALDKLDRAIQQKRRRS